VERREGGKKFPGRDPENAVGTVTLYNELVVLSRLLKRAKREKLIDSVPEFERPTQTTDYEVPSLSPDDVQRFLAELPTRAKHPRRYPVKEFARFAWAMALRFTETRSIKWSDVDLAGRRLKVRAEIDKTGREWILPLTEEARAVLAVEALRPHKPDGVIFPLKNVRASFKLAGERLSFPNVTPHHLRHFRITDWANSTRRLAAVQFMARHLSIATTAKYVRSRTEAAEEMLQEIAAAASKTADSKTAPPENSKTVAYAAG
jgi:integrase